MLIITKLSIDSNHCIFRESLKAMGNELVLYALCTFDESNTAMKIWKQI